MYLTARSCSRFDPYILAVLILFCCGHHFCIHSTFEKCLVPKWVRHLLQHFWLIWLFHFRFLFCTTYEYTRAYKYMYVILYTLVLYVNVSKLLSVYDAHTVTSMLKLPYDKTLSSAHFLLFYSILLNCLHQITYSKWIDYYFCLR